MIRRFLLLTCAGLLILSGRLLGGPLQVVTTTSDLASIAREVGGEKVLVTALTDGRRDPHYVDPRPSMVAQIRRADLFIIVGMDLDLWAYSLMDAARNPRVRFGQTGFLDVSAAIEKMDALPAGARVDGSMGDIHPLGNPHYWLDPENGRIIAREIAERLSRISPEDARCFQANLEQFEKRLDACIAEGKKSLVRWTGEPIVTYHRSWIYFAKRFGLRIAGELEPKPGIPPSPSHLSETVRKMQQDHVRVILVEVFYDRKGADFVAGRTGARVVMLPNSVGGTPEAADYLSLFSSIYERLRKGFE